MVITLGYKAYSGYKNTCLGGNGKDCMAKSDRLVKQQLLPEAETYSLKACHLKEYEGCLRYAEIATLKQDISLAREYYFQACKLNKEGCYASIEFEISKGNLRDALSMAGIPCNEENDLKSCYYLGLIKIRQEDYELGSNLLKKSCEGQIAEACYFYALFLHDHASKDGYLYYLNEACKLGDGKACTRLSR